MALRLVDLRKGHPKVTNLPHAKLAQAARRAALRLDEAQETHFGLGYTGNSGTPRFLGRLAAFLSQAYGSPCLQDNLLTTNGVSHGIDIACGALTMPGDGVWVESATYFLAHQVFLDHGLRVTAVPMDEHGLDTDALARCLASGELGPPPALLYLVPSHGNPSGATLPIGRRHALLDLAERYGFICLTDDVYHLLDWSHLKAGAHRPPVGTGPSGTPPPAQPPPARNLTKGAPSHSAPTQGSAWPGPDPPPPRLLALDRAFSAQVVESGLHPATGNNQDLVHMGGNRVG